jgi:pSer/pThr/pTyr-binding forkhead associated (FHA) protein
LIDPPGGGPYTSHVSSGPPSGASPRPPAASPGLAGQPTSRASGDEERTTLSGDNWEESTTIADDEALEPIGSPISHAELPAASSLAIPMAGAGPSALTSTGTDEHTVDEGPAGASLPTMPSMPSNLALGRGAARVVFIVDAGPDAGRRFELQNPRPASIGRATDNDLVLADIAVSRRHVMLRFDGTSWLARDQGSGNGTVINDRLEDGEVALRHGDRLEIGNTVIRVEHLGTAARGAPPAFGDPADDDARTVDGRAFRDGNAEYVLPPRPPGAAITPAPELTGLPPPAVRPTAAIGSAAPAPEVQQRAQAPTVAPVAGARRPARTTPPPLRKPSHGEPPATAGNLRATFPAAAPPPPPAPVDMPALPPMFAGPNVPPPAPVLGTMLPPIRPALQTAPPPAPAVYVPMPTPVTEQATLRGAAPIAPAAATSHPPPPALASAAALPAPRRRSHQAMAPLGERGAPTMPVPHHQRLPAPRQAPARATTRPRWLPWAIVSGVLLLAAGVSAAILLTGSDDPPVALPMLGGVSQLADARAATPVPAIVVDARPPAPPDATPVIAPVVDAAPVVAPVVDAAPVVVPVVDAGLSAAELAAKAAKDKAERDERRRKEEEERRAREAKAEAGADAALEKAEGQYEDGSPATAAATLRAAMAGASAKTRKRLGTEASDYEAIARGLGAAKSSAIDGHKAVKAAIAADKRAGSALAGKLKAVMAAVAPKAAAAYLAATNFEAAYGATVDASGAGAGGNATVKTVLSTLERKAGELYASGKAKLKTSPDAGKADLRRIPKIVPKSSSWVAKAQAALDAAS